MAVRKRRKDFPVVKAFDVCVLLSSDEAKSDSTFAGWRDPVETESFGARDINCGFRKGGGLAVRRRGSMSVPIILELYERINDAKFMF